MPVSRAPVEGEIRDFRDLERERSERGVSASDVDLPSRAELDGAAVFDPLELLSRYSSLDESLRGVPFN